MKVEYESFVNSPEEELGQTLDFLETSRLVSPREAAVAQVSSKAIGKVGRKLRREWQAPLELMAPALTRHGYAMPDSDP